MARVRYLKATEGEKYNISNFPNFSKTGSITEMKNKYYGKEALLVQCVSYIYNVSSVPEIYEKAKQY